MSKKNEKQEITEFGVPPKGTVKPEGFLTGQTNEIEAKPVAAKPEEAAAARRKQAH